MIQYRYKETSNPGTVTYEGKLLTAANGNASTVTGAGVTCSKTGTGVYTFTLDKPAKKLVNAAFGCASATVLVPMMTPSGDNVSGAGTVVVTLKDASGTNTNATSGDTLFFSITVDKLGLL